MYENSIPPFFFITLTGIVVIYDFYHSFWILKTGLDLEKFERKYNAKKEHSGKGK